MLAWLLTCNASQRVQPCKTASTPMSSSSRSPCSHKRPSPAQSTSSRTAAYNAERLNGTASSARCKMAACMVGPGGSGVHCGRNPADR